jgi:hypothetical protein
MAQYSISEYADMHLVYGECLSNSHEAMRRYAERFPNRRHPNRKTFEAVARRLRETGSVLPKGNEIGRPRELDIDEAMLQRVEEAPEASTRELGRHLMLITGAFGTFCIKIGVQ